MRLSSRLSAQILSQAVLLTALSAVFLPTISARALTRDSMVAFNQFFVFADVPLDRVRKARQLGRNLRQSFVRSLESGELHNEEHEIEYYTQQFTKCSGVGEAATAKLFPVAEGTTPATRRLAELWNLDAVSSRFLSLPVEQQENGIRHSCAESELKFQCAYGFIDSAEKIRQHISQMKETDGNFKVMAERECPLVDREDKENAPTVDRQKESVYSCVAKGAEDILRLCQQPIRTYNSTRGVVNRQIQRKFQDAISIIDLRLMKADQQGRTDEEALDKILKESEQSVHQTLREILPLEALKCSSFNQMETCIFGSIFEVCPNDAGSIVDALSTLLRVGYLAREREDFLHQHFVESGIGPHPECKQPPN